MKLKAALFTTFVVLTYSLIFFTPVHSMDDPGFTIKRMVMAKQITDREPSNITNTFSVTDETAYCFLEVRDIEFDTTVSFVWYHEGNEMARVTLPLQKGWRWRTYSSKKLANQQGKWIVELQEASGIVLNSVSFTVK